jgi:type IV pilus assembly protein PilB
VSDPGNAATMDALRQSLGREFVAVVAGPEQVERAIAQLYSHAGSSAPPATPPDSASVPPLWPVSGAPSIEDNGAANGAAPSEVGILDQQEDADPSGAPPDPGSLVVDRAAADGKGTSPASGPPPAPDGYGIVADTRSVDLSGLPPDAPALARVLVEARRVTVEDMTAALGAYRQSGESLARYLFNRGLATEDDLVRGMANEVGLDYVDLSTFPVDPRAASMLPESVARHHMVLPVRIENGVPLVAMANPSDVYAMDDLRTIMGRNFTPVVATRSQIATQIRLAYEGDVDMSGLAEDAAVDVAPSAGGFELESLQSVVEDAPIVRYVNLLILQALNERASDIHIEPTPRRLRIRFRIDGVMQDATSASASIHPAVVSRLKVLGEMDIAEHRIPQEGRVSLSVGDRQIDLRLATLPSMFGETCVMRLLDKSASIRGLPELGFFPDTLDRYSEAYKRPYGVILVTGPTGAGKTTTVYGTLQEVMTKEKSVVTVEDPVEYQIDGITQVQINHKAGLDFARALRSILRSDPDIVLIGEVRDTPTATIAMEAALSGHLVLTTLHTNTASATPLRLTEMGIEPFLVTSSITGILTQRLARVLCKQCKEPYSASEKDFVAAGYKEADLDGVDTSTLYRAVGCRSCSQTGYHGRMVLAEVLLMTEEIDRMIIEQQPMANIEREACEQGMRTLRMDGLLKVVGGETTLQEVLRVVI